MFNLLTKSQRIFWSIFLRTFWKWWTLKEIFLEPKSRRYILKEHLYQKWRNLDFFSKISWPKIVDFYPDTKLRTFQEKKIKDLLTRKLWLLKKIFFMNLQTKKRGLLKKLFQGPSDQKVCTLEDKIEGFWICSFLNKYS